MVVRAFIFSTALAFLIICSGWSLLGVRGEESLFSGSVYPPCPIKASDFFPLQVGNSWAYDIRFAWSDSTQSVTTRVIGTTMIGGKEYFLVKDYFGGWPHSQPDSVLLRQEDAKIYWYLEGTEYLYYDFSAPAGGAYVWMTEHSWPVPIFDDGEVVSVRRGKSFETPCCMIFTMDMPWSDDKIDESFTRAIGRTYLCIKVGDWWDAILREAVIGGQKYTPPFVDPESYFPLQVGARWTYRRVGDTEGPETVTTKVTGTTSINGREYFLVEDSLIKQARKVLPDTLLLRKEGSRIYLFLDDREHLLYEFSAPHGPMCVPTIQTREISSCRLSAGPGCALFYVYDSLPGKWVELFAPDIGKIQVLGLNYMSLWQLEEMVIDGETTMRKTTWGEVKSYFK